MRKFSSPYTAANRGYVDQIIEPKKTRPTIISALEALSTKEVPKPNKRHGNMPLLFMRAADGL